MEKIDLGKKNIVLVTGNGFDAACYLKCKYADYFRYLRKIGFRYNNEKYVYLIESMDLKTTYGDKISNLKDYQSLAIPFGIISQTSFWEIFLYWRMKSYEKEESDIDWFDVETEIKKSLAQGDFWDQVFDYIYLNKKETQDLSDNPILSVSIMADAVSRRLSTNLSQMDKKDARKDFFNLLLQELNKLESNFGSYIKKIARGRYKKIRNENLETIVNCFETCENIKILTFNYTSVSPCNYDITYMHGNLDNPIFGIDSSPNGSNELTAFTKNHRRVDAKIATYSKALKGVDDSYALVFYGTSFGDSDFEDYSFLLNRFDTICVLYSDFDLIEHKDSITEKFCGLYNRVKNLQNDDTFYKLFDDGKMFVEKIDFDE